MKFSSILLLALGLFTVASSTPVDDQSFPEFTIDLDLAPHERFVEVVTHFQKPIILTFNTLMAEFGDLAKPVTMFFEATSWIWRLT